MSDLVNELREEANRRIFGKPGDNPAEALLRQAADRIGALEQLLGALRAMCSPMSAWRAQIDAALREAEDG